VLVLVLVLGEDEVVVEVLPNPCPPGKPVPNFGNERRRRTTRSNSGNIRR